MSIEIGRAIVTPKRAKEVNGSQDIRAHFVVNKLDPMTEKALDHILESEQIENTALVVVVSVEPVSRAKTE